MKDVVACIVNSAGDLENPLDALLPPLTDPSIAMDADAASLVTESSSEAVVSVFQSWSATDETPPLDWVKSNAGNPETTVSTSSFFDSTHSMDSLTGSRSTLRHDLEALKPEQLLQRLKKRVREQDLPSVPILKRRKRPTCCFINYLSHGRPIQTESCPFGELLADADSAAVVSEIDLLELQPDTAALLEMDLDESVVLGSF